jgi:flagellar basal-body rod protein FlgB
MSNLIDNDQTKLLAKYLDLNVYRQGLLSSNIANIDTPGYHTKDIDFKGELQRSMNGFSDGADGAASPFGPTVKEVPDLDERPDGNNVSIDRESMMLSATQLQFKLGVELLRDQFKGISMAINDGKAS